MKTIGRVIMVLSSALAMGGGAIQMNDDRGVTAEVAHGTLPHGHGLAAKYPGDRGIARETRTPRPERVVVTRTALRIRKGDHVEEIPLDKSKDLKAFALIFPTILRGERGELERAFDIGLHGSEAGWWALVFTPKAESMRALVRRVVVFGKTDQLVALQVVEASGDTTDTHLADVRRNGDVPDAEIAAAFGAP